MTYVGSADNVEYDQVLEEALVGPIPRGTHKFVLEVSFKALSLATRRRRDTAPSLRTGICAGLRPH